MSMYKCEHCGEWIGFGEPHQECKAIEQLKARIAELHTWRTKVLDESYRSRVAGHPEVCVYCSAGLLLSHQQWCPIGQAPEYSDETKEGGA
jgi:hypothetical protein